MTLEQVQDELRAKGYVWHSFHRSYVAEDGEERFWFNGSYCMGTAGLTRQPCGWFTLEEMRAEKFAEGCR